MLIITIFLQVLLSLVLERLESMAANSQHNYDYVVLQATNNSIPFYESMGFIRVGAVTKNNNPPLNNENKDGEIEQKMDEAKDLTIDFTTGPVIREKSKPKETLRQFCKRLNVDVWDVVFLNKDIYPGISYKSILQENTELFVPDKSKMDGGSNAELCNKAGNDSVTLWYDAKDNETPREIAKKFNLCVKELLAANRGRIEGLQVHSKLVEGYVISSFTKFYD